MGFYRIFPEKDSYITNRSYDTLNESSGSNHGESPALNVFSFIVENFTGSISLARSMVQFGLSELSGKIYEDLSIPSSSVTYKLRMFDMKHADTLPSSYDLFVYPLSRSWDEGNGIDDDEGLDTGAVNWLQPVSTSEWTLTGSDYLTNHGSGSQHFDRGDEDLEVDITDVVVSWLTSSLNNNGFLIKLGDTEEALDGYFRKVFHGRESKYIDRIPFIEARWDSVQKDHRDNFAFGTSSNLYLYNLVRGELTSLTEPVIARIQDSLGSSSYVSELTASVASVGVYTASFTVPIASTYLSATWVDVWSSGSTTYMSGTFTPLRLTGSQFDPYDEFDVSVVNLNRVYREAETARLIVDVRKRDYITHVGPISSASLDTSSREHIEKMYYSVVNDDSGETVIPFGTGSIPYTQLSYGEMGNYFNIEMSSFVPGYKYRLLFLIDINKYDKKIIDSDSVFKVV